MNKYAKLGVEGVALNFCEKGWLEFHISLEHNLHFETGLVTILHFQRDWHENIKQKLLSRYMIHNKYLKIRNRGLVISRRLK